MTQTKLFCYKICIEKEITRWVFGVTHYKENEWPLSHTHTSGDLITDHIHSPLTQHPFKYHPLYTLSS